MEQRNKVAFLWVPAFVLFLFCTYAEGAVYKCPTASGGFIYSNKPCLDGHRKEGNGWINVEEESRKESEEEEKRARQAQQAQEREQQILRSERAIEEATRKAREAQLELDIDPRTQCDKVMKGETNADRSYQPIYGPCCKNLLAMKSKEAMEKCIGQRGAEEMLRIWRKLDVKMP